MTEQPRDYSIPGLFRDTQDLAEMIRPALAALPAAAVSEFLGRLADAAIAHARGDEEALGQLFFGVVAEYQLNRNADYRQALKEVTEAEAEGPPQETDVKALFSSLRAGR
jgi:hypothetical protein